MHTSPPLLGIGTFLLLILLLTTTFSPNSPIIPPVTCLTPTSPSVTNTLIYGLGSNVERQLGMGNDYMDKPTFMTSQFENIPTPPKIIRAATGDKFSLFLSQDDRLFGLGYINNQIHVTPTEISPSQSGNITNMWTGWNHFFFQLKNGSIVGAGSNEHLQLTFSTDVGTVLQPTVIPYSNVSDPLRSNFSQIVANGANSFFLTQGKLFGCGNGLLLGRNVSISTPIRLSVYGASPDSILFESMAVGYDHLVIIGQDGKVYGMGSNEFHQLGNSSLNTMPLSEIFSGRSSGERATQVVAGRFNTLVLLNSGVVFATGDNAYNQLAVVGSSMIGVFTQIFASSTGIESIYMEKDRSMIKLSDGRLMTTMQNSSQLVDFSTGGFLEGQLEVLSVSSGSVHSIYITDGDYRCNGIYSANHALVCSGHGMCQSRDTCECALSYTGADCSIAPCYGIAANAENVCGGHGSCQTGSCTCDSGYNMSDECNEWSCFGQEMDSPLACSSQGNCTALNTCHCESGYFGDACDMWSCFGQEMDSPLACSSQGNCTAPDTCHCDNGFYGNNCSVWKCNDILSTDPNVCSNSGTCNKNGTCTCLPGYMSEDCHLFQLEPIIDTDFRNLITCQRNITFKAVIPNAYMEQFPYQDSSVFYTWRLQEYKSGGRSSPAADTSSVQELEHLLSNTSGASFTVDRSLLLPGYEYSISLSISHHTGDGFLSVYPSIPQTITFTTSSVPAEQYLLPLVETNFPESDTIRAPFGSYIEVDAHWWFGRGLDCPHPAMNEFNVHIMGSSTAVNLSSIVSLTSSKTIIPRIPTDPFELTFTFTDPVSNVKNITHFNVQGYDKGVKTVLSGTVPSQISIQDKISIDASNSYDAHGTFADSLFGANTTHFHWRCVEYPEGASQIKQVIDSNTGSLLNMKISDHLGDSFVKSVLGSYTIEVSAQKYQRVHEFKYVKFTVVEKQEPLLVSVQQLHSGGNIDVSRRAAFSAKVFVAEDISNLEYEWFISSNMWNDSHTTAMFENHLLGIHKFSSVNVSTTTGDSKQTLVIEPNQLQYGHLYWITVRVHSQLGFSQNATIPLDLISRPQVGSFSVSPSSGESMRTPFTLSASGWTTSTDSLEYKFVLVQNEREQVLRRYSSSPTVSRIFLPYREIQNQLSSETNSTGPLPVTLRVYARDSLQRTNSMETTVLVHASESHNNSSFLIDSINQLLSHNEDLTDSEKTSTLMSAASQMMTLSGDGDAPADFNTNTNNTNTSLENQYKSLRHQMLNQLQQVEQSPFSSEDDLDVQEQQAYILRGITHGASNRTISNDTVNATLLFAEKKLQNKNRPISQNQLENYVHSLASLASVHTTNAFASRLDNGTSLIVDSLYSLQYDGERMKSFNTPQFAMSVVKGDVASIEGQSLQDEKYAIQIPRGVFRKNFSTIGAKMRLSQVNPYFDASQNNVSSPIFSLSFLTGEENVQHSNHFASPVEFSIQGNFDLQAIEQDEEKDGIRPLCSYWDHKNSTWSTEGVQLVSITSKRVVCVTNHTTDFSLLMKFVPAPNILDFNFITGEDSIIHLNADNYATSVVMFVLWIVYIIGMIVLEILYNISWGIREHQLNKKARQGDSIEESDPPVKIGAYVNGRRRYLEPLWHKFKELHLWLSVILLPATENQQFTRSQRLTVLAMLVLGIGLSNALSCGIADEVQYWITCVMSDFLVAPFIGFGLFMFSKVKPRRRTLKTQPALKKGDESADRVFASSHDKTQPTAHAETLPQSVAPNNDKSQQSTSTSTALRKASTDDSSTHSLLQRMHTEIQRNMKSVSYNKNHFIEQADLRIDAIAQLFLKAKVRVYGTIIFFLCTALYFALIAVGCYLIYQIQWLGIIGISIYAAGGIVSYFGIMNELYIQSKTKAFMKGKIQWHSRYTVVNVVASAVILIAVVALSITGIILVMTVDRESVEFTDDLRVGVSTVIVVFMVGMSGVLVRNVVSAVKSPLSPRSRLQKKKKQSKVKTFLTAHWFPWWFKYPVYVMCWSMMIVASWLLVMYGIKFAREGAERDFFFALICANNQNFWLDNPSGIILSVLVGSIMLRLFEAFFFPRDQIIGLDAMQEEEGVDADDLDPQEIVAEMEQEIPRRGGLGGLSKVEQQESEKPKLVNVLGKSVKQVLRKSPRRVQKVQDDCSESGGSSDGNRSSSQEQDGNRVYQFQNFVPQSDA